MPTHATVGCVSYLNAKPLIHQIDQIPNLNLILDIPSALLEKLISDEVDLALCPVIDFQLAPEELAIVPAGGIACDAETLTVRLFSKLPFDQLTHIKVDAHSHTSIMLLRILMKKVYDIEPEIEVVDLLGQTENNAPTAFLAIGDKVITMQTDVKDYPHQLDLGQAWHDFTGLPFVFATWMCKKHQNQVAIGSQLRKLLQDNLKTMPSIVATYASQLGWPQDIAMKYLTELLHYPIGQKEKQAMALFWDLCHSLGYTDQHREPYFVELEP